MLELWTERTVPSLRTAIALPYPQSVLGSWETEAHQAEQGTGLAPVDCCVRGQSAAHRVCQCVLGDLRASSWEATLQKVWAGKCWCQFRVRHQDLHTGTIFCTYSDSITHLMGFGNKIRVFRGTQRMPPLGLPSCSRSQLLIFCWLLIM